MDQPKPHHFCYFDGSKLVYGDALAIYLDVIIRTEGKPNDLANKVFGVKPDDPDAQKVKESWHAAKQLLALIRKVLKMKRFNKSTGRGASDEHCWAAWFAFCDYMAASPSVVKAALAYPTLPAPNNSTSLLRLAQPSVN